MAKCFYCEQDHPPCEALLTAHRQLVGAYARLRGQASLLELDFTAIEDALAGMREILRRDSLIDKADAL